MLPTDQTFSHDLHPNFAAGISWRAQCATESLSALSEWPGQRDRDRRCASMHAGGRPSDQSGQGIHSFERHPGLACRESCWGWGRGSAD